MMGVESNRFILVSPTAVTKEKFNEVVNGVQVRGGEERRTEGWGEATAAYRHRSSCISPTTIFKEKFSLRSLRFAPRKCRQLL